MEDRSLAADPCISRTPRPDSSIRLSHTRQKPIRIICKLAALSVRVRHGPDVTRIVIFERGGRRSERRVGVSMQPLPSLLCYLADCLAMLRHRMNEVCILTHNVILSYWVVVHHQIKLAPGRLQVVYYVLIYIAAYSKCQHHPYL